MLKEKETYPSVKACAESMRRCLPLLHLVQRIAKERGDKKELEQATLLITFLEVSDTLEKTLARAANKDGSVTFTYTPEALAVLLSSMGEEKLS